VGNQARPVLETALGQRLLSLWNRQMVVTLVLLALGFVFWAYFRRGFTRRVIQLSVVVVAVYLALNAVVIAAGLYHLATHPALVRSWAEGVAAGRWHAAGVPFTGRGWAAAA